MILIDFIIVRSHCIIEFDILVTQNGLHRRNPWDVKEA